MRANKWCKESYTSFKNGGPRVQRWQESSPEVCCPPNAHRQQKSFGLLFPKQERCGLGGKQRARCCHLIPAPSFRLTPNEAKGGSPYERVSKALCYGLVIKGNKFFGSFKN